MGKGNYLGEFEQMVLLALLQTRSNAYGVSIRREIQDRTDRIVAIGAVYSALDRLERKGYVSSKDSDPQPVRGGRTKRIFKITRQGNEVLLHSRAMMAEMARGLELGQDAEPA
jgi:PadR family transcriptional regulator PadR